jgi:hypothetical protein
MQNSNRFGRMVVKEMVVKEPFTRPDLASDMPATILKRGMLTA